MEPFELEIIRIVGCNIGNDGPNCFDRGAINDTHTFDPLRSNSYTSNSISIACIDNRVSTERSSIMLSSPSCGAIFKLAVVLLSASFFLGCNSQTEVAESTEQPTIEPFDVELSRIDGVSMKRTADTSSVSITVTEDGRFQASAPLVRIILFVAEDTAVIDNASLSEDQFLIEIEPPESLEHLDEHIRAQLSQLFADCFDIKFESVEEETSVFVVSIQESGVVNVETTSETSTPSWRSSTDEFEFRRHSFNDLANFISNALDDFVIDETGDSVLYDFDLPFNFFDIHEPDAWSDALPTIGLRLERAERKVRFTSIDKINEK